MTNRLKGWRPYENEEQKDEREDGKMTKIDKIQFLLDGKTPQGKLSVSPVIKELQEEINQSVCGLSDWEKLKSNP